MASMTNHLQSIWAQAMIFVVLVMLAFSVSARGVYQTDEAFLAETFDGNVPKSKVIWVKGDLRQTIADILGHPYSGLRIRYWERDGRSAWILNEIGKEQPITFGIVIQARKISHVKVLAFRESRGGEIRHPAFTQQFKEAQLVGQELDRHIDGVSGATLSVWAMTAVTRLALYLDTFTT
tara:strand:+ start:152 stop:688 length:537 start_codon:yes stop_codon:yes gene_type:complete